MFGFPASAGVVLHTCVEGSRHAESPQQYLAEAGLYRKNSGTQDYAFGKFVFRKLIPEDLNKKRVLLMGPTPRLPDYVVDDWRKNGIRVEEFPDPMGYISFRIASL